MKENILLFTPVVTLLSYGVFLCWSLYNPPIRVGIKETIEVYEGKLAKLQQKLDDANDTIKYNDSMSDKFINERCVCVNWNSSANEPALSRQEICNTK